MLNIRHSQRFQLDKKKSKKIKQKTFYLIIVTPEFLQKQVVSQICHFISLHFRIHHPNYSILLLKYFFICLYKFKIQIVIQRIIYISSMQQCRNGPGCYFLSQGRCWYYHPSWHGPNTQPVLYSNSHRFRLTNVHQPYNQNNYEEQEQQQSVMDEEQSVQQNDSNEDWIKQYNYYKNKNKQSMNNEQDTQPRTAIIKGKQIKLQQIKCQLPDSKRWYFQNIHHYEYFPQIGQQQCSICLSKFNHNGQQLITSLFCKHDFHHQCIYKWLQTSNQCPLCRIDFRRHKQFQAFKGYQLHQLGSEDQDDEDVDVDFDVDGLLQQYEVGSYYSYNSGDYDDDYHMHDGDLDFDIDYEYQF